MNTTYLTAQLRESAPYLREAGWGETARLLIAAAAEIEHQRVRLSELAPTKTPVQRAAPFLRRLIAMR